MKDPILWPQPDGTSRTIEAGDVRALVGYVEQRDGICKGLNPQTPCSALAEAGGTHCAEHRRMIDDFESYHDGRPNITG